MDRRMDKLGFIYQISIKVQWKKKSCQQSIIKDAVLYAMSYFLFWIMIQVPCIRFLDTRYMKILNEKVKQDLEDAN